MDPEILNADQGGDAPEPVIETADPAPEPTAEAAAPEGAEGEGAEASAEPVVEAPKHKVPQSVQKRIDKLSYDAKTAQERAEAAEARAAAAEAILAAQGGEVPTAAAKPAKDVETAAAELVATREFNAKADATFDAGSKAFGPEAWNESLGMLNALGVMDVPFLQAALLTEAPEKVIHALGQDPDEAVRIAGLAAGPKAIALDRLARTLATPAKPKISNVPAPIKTVDGSGRGAADIYDPNLSDDEYYAIRAKERAAHFAGR